ncbi:MAG: hypothetical protein ABRQ25_07200 [Clostridiaceae bacterium]
MAEFIERKCETARYVVTSIDKYNYIGRIDKGRADGVNTHFFKLKHTFYGWYVAEDNSGP